MKITPKPCRYCGSPPHTRSVDMHSKLGDTYLFTHIQIECSDPECGKKHREHRHFHARATRRECVMAWNRRN